jgi:hypothetical protein
VPTQENKDDASQIKIIQKKSRLNVLNLLERNRKFASSQQLKQRSAFEKG